MKPKIVPISSSSLVFKNLWEINNKKKRVKVAYIMCSLRLMEFSPRRHIFENMLRSFWGWKLEILRINLWLSWTILIRGNLKKKQYICGHYPNLGWPPSLLPYFWQIYFWQSVDHVDLPPSPRIFDKNHEILGFETYNLNYPYYFLRVRGTDRKTQSPFNGFF